MPTDIDSHRQNPELALALRARARRRAFALRRGSRRPPPAGPVDEHLERAHDVGRQPYAGSLIHTLRHVHRMAAGAREGFSSSSAPAARRGRCSLRSLSPTTAASRPSRRNRRTPKGSATASSSSRSSSSAIFVLVEGLLIAFIVKYRRRKRARFEDGAPIHGATKLEIVWTAFPVVDPLPDRRVRLHRAARDQGHPVGRAQAASSRSGSPGSSTTGSTSTRTASSRSTRCARRPAFRSDSRSPRPTPTSSIPGGFPRSEARSTRSPAP